MGGIEVGLVQALARYPVKSLRGETCSELRLVRRGVAGDRAYALYGRDGKIGSGKTTRRFRRMAHLLEAKSWSEGDRTMIRFPSGASFEVTDPALTASLSVLVGEPVELLAEGRVKHLDDGPVHLITIASLRWLRLVRAGYDADPARFRPNVLIDVEGSDRVEDTWVGRSLLVGTARLRVTGRTERCVMPTMAQPGFSEQPSLLSDLADLADQCLGVYAEVDEPGQVRVGDAVRLG